MKRTNIHKSEKSRKELENEKLREKLEKVRQEYNDLFNEWNAKAGAREPIRCDRDLPPKLRKLRRKMKRLKKQISKNSVRTKQKTLF